MSPSQLVPLADLRDDLSLRVRPDDPAMIAILAPILPATPPILIDPDGRIVDGHARVAAARARGWHSIKAIYTDVGADRAALIRLAITANAAHGQPLTSAQRRHAVTLLLHADPCVSDREAARICGCAPRTVAEIRRTMVATEDNAGTVTGPARRRGRDGKLYPASRDHVRGALAAATAAHSGPVSARQLARAAHVSPTTAANHARAAAADAPPEQDTSPSESAQDRGATISPESPAAGQLDSAATNPGSWLARLWATIRQLLTGWRRARTR